MRKLAILTFQTLDGVMRAPKLPEEDCSGGFKQGGWANECWDEVMEQVGREAMAEPYDLLLGKNTYDIFASSHVDAAAGNSSDAQITKLKKYVVTSSMDKLLWANSERIVGNVAAEISKLKAQEGPLLQVHGSWQLIQTLLCEQLIDEFRLWTFPVVVGAGKRLFADGAVPTSLELIRFETCPSGAFMNIWRPRYADQTSSR